MGLPCLDPIKGYRDRLGKVCFARPRDGSAVLAEVRCGQCVHCRTDTAQRRGVRIYDEVKMAGGQAVMCTLTYDDDHLPPDVGLSSLDLKRFHWRANDMFGGGLKYASAGEYGERRLRPHYHAIFVNRVFDDLRYEGKSRSGFPLYESETLRKLWPFGRAIVSEFHVDVAMYVAGYALKKINGPQAEEHYERQDKFGELHVVSREFFRQSQNMGRRFFDKFWEETYVHDARLVNGRKVGVPRRYDEWLKKFDESRFEEVKIARMERGAQACIDHAEDRSTARRVVMEKIAVLDRDRFVRDV